MRNWHGAGYKTRIEPWGLCAENIQVSDEVQAYVCDNVMLQTKHMLIEHNAKLQGWLSEQHILTKCFTKGFDWKPLPPCCSPSSIHESHASATQEGLKKLIALGIGYSDSITGSLGLFEYPKQLQSQSQHPVRSSSILGILRGMKGKMRGWG